MVTAGLVFIYAFLPLCLILYYSFKSIKARNTVLLVFSLFFYAWGEPVRVLQMLLSGFSVWIFSLFIEKNKAEPEKRKRFLILALISALLPLVIFKYSDFLIENINALLSTNIKQPQLGLPIGISFYTFQIITYAVDLYRGDCEVQLKFSRFLLYQSFFPQLVAGPIVRYSDIDDQIANRQFKPQQLKEGVSRFLVGLSKKVLLANYAGKIVVQTLSSETLPRIGALEAFLGMLAFSYQIYFDFSGYSDMAIGLGKMFSFEFKENFNYPYISESVSDFWRRWHISLGSFFRDYVYIPMGGNRRHQMLNIFTVWFLTGLWHGASWNFIIWGMYFCLLLIIEKLWLGDALLSLPIAAGRIYTAIAVYFGWVLFKFENLDEIGLFFKRLFGAGGFSGIAGKSLFRENIIFFIIAVICSLPIVPYLRRKGYLPGHSLESASSEVYAVVGVLQVLILIFLCTAALAGDSFNPFLYYRF